LEDIADQDGIDVYQFEEEHEMWEQSGNEHDFIQSIATLSSFCLDYEETETLCRSLWARAICRIPCVWRAISALAQALVTQKTINGKEASQIVRDAVGDDWQSWHSDITRYLRWGRGPLSKSFL
jgi:hypothetical protein